MKKFLAISTAICAFAVSANAGKFDLYHAPAGLGLSDEDCAKLHIRQEAGAPAEQTPFAEPSNIVRGRSLALNRQTKTLMHFRAALEDVAYDSPDFATFSERAFNFNREQGELWEASQNLEKEKEALESIRFSQYGSTTMNEISKQLRNKSFLNIPFFRQLDSTLTFNSANDFQAYAAPIYKRTVLQNLPYGLHGQNTSMHAVYKMIIEHPDFAKVNLEKHPKLRDDLRFLERFSGIILPEAEDGAGAPAAATPAPNAQTEDAISENDVRLVAMSLTCLQQKGQNIDPMHLDVDSLAGALLAEVKAVSPDSKLTEKAVSMIIHKYILMDD